jgi:hypothetical protein
LSVGKITWRGTLVERKLESSKESSLSGPSRRTQVANLNESAEVIDCYLLNYRAVRLITIFIIIELCNPWRSPPATQSRSSEKRSGIIQMVPNLKRKKNRRLVEARGPTHKLEPPDTSALYFAPHPSSPESSPSVRMSGSDQPVCRMTTRGGGKEKMTKAVAVYRSGGMEDFEQEDSKAAGKKVKRPKSKKADTEITPATVSKLATLEDKFLEKAEAIRSTHPRRWTDDVSGNVFIILLRRNSILIRRTRD